ncbi:MAG TPA: hypothetical protein VGF57_04200 [Roseiarcus sp.]
MAKLPQTIASPRKLKQIKLLAFAFSYFSESGLFNGLHAIQTRKIWLPSPYLAAARKARAQSWDMERHSTDF